MIKYSVIQFKFILLLTFFIYDNVFARNYNIIVEKGKDIFDFNNHIKLALSLENKRNVRMEKCDQDIIFLE